MKRENEQLRARERMLLLDKGGQLKMPSWASSGVYVYNKERLRFAPRRSEWEFYQLSNRHWALQLSYGHGPGAGMAGVTLVDLETGKKSSAGSWRIFPGDSYDLDFAGGEAHSLHSDKGDFSLSVGFDGKLHSIRCHTAGLSADLAFPDEGSAIVTALPFRRRGQFSYLYRKNYLDVRGEVSLNGRKYLLDEETFMIQSSARGLWPYRHGWVWGAGTVRAGEHILGINLGWGLGGSPRATENALFWDGRIQKLGRVKESCDPQDFMRPWGIREESGRLDVAFRPLFDNYEARDLLLLSCRRHQVFGELSGRAVLNDGTVVDLNAMPFFCEHTRSRW